MSKKLLCALAVAMLVSPILAQPAAPVRGISPVYEGFVRNADGTFDLLFGYFNRSWSEEFDLPVGAANSMEPGGPDRGQPAHFFPRRSRFVFKVRVPADFANKEVVWTLTVNGETHKAYGTLRPAYAVDDGVMMTNFGGPGVAGNSPDMVGNKAPQLAVEGSRTLTAKVSQPVTLRAMATDDGKLAPRSVPSFLLGEGHYAPVAAAGLRLQWFKYRGPGRVDFDPPQAKVWEDTRDGSSSPWSVGWKTPPVPAGNRWVVTATFRQPGTYVLRALAHDGGLMDYDDVTVTVTP